MKLNINGVSVEVEDTVLTEALEAKKESIDIKSDDLVVRTSTKHDELISNTKRDSQVIGEEIGRKEVFKDLEIDIEGTGDYKSSERSATALKKWSKGLSDAAVKTAGVPTDEKLEQANADMEILRGTLRAAQGDLETEQSGRKSDAKKLLISGKITDLLAKENIALSSKATKTLMMSDMRFDSDDNGNVFQLNNDGTPMKDNEANTLPLSQSITSFLDSDPMYRKGAAGGGGGTDSKNGGKKKTFEQFNTEQQEAGNQLNGEVYRAEMEKQQESGLLEA